jgi:hypothetical protein
VPDNKSNGGEGGIQLLALITKDLHAIPLKTCCTELLELFPFISELLPVALLRIHRYTSMADYGRAGDLAAVPGLSPTIPAKGRQLRITELSLWHIVNGKASEEWDLYDNWGASIQLGLIDPQRISPVQIAT